jgi:NOL1/NOP2/fmu family ribosome biogenesis protein
MKKLMRTLIILSFFLLASWSKLSAQTVYITESGKKFHAKNCDIVKTGKKGIELGEAKKKGLEPCKSCKAEAIKPEDKKAPATKGKK